MRKIVYFDTSLTLYSTRQTTSSESTYVVNVSFIIKALSSLLDTVDRLVITSD